MMTERFEITTLLQKELVNDPEVFGKVDPGTPEQAVGATWRACTT